MQRMHLRISCFVKLLRAGSTLLSMHYPDVEMGAGLLPHAHSSLARWVALASRAFARYYTAVVYGGLIGVQKSSGMGTVIFVAAALVFVLVFAVPAG